MDIVWETFFPLLQQPEPPSILLREQKSINNYPLTNWFEIQEKN